MQAGQYESLANFKERFDFCFKNYLEQGNTDKDEQDRAMDFMYAHDEARYGGFVAKILNDVAKSAITQPNTINAVLNLAVSRVVVSRHVTSRHTGASFSTIDEEARKTRDVERGQKKRGKTRGGKNTAPRLTEGKSPNDNDMGQEGAESGDGNAVTAEAKIKK